VVTAAEWDALAAAVGEHARRDAPLGALTTYGVGGTAAVLVEVEGPSELEALRVVLAGRALDTFVIGRGSNVLVADSGFDGVAVRLGSGFNFVELPPEIERLGASGGATVVRTGGATPLPVLARQVGDAGWSGLSWAVGVPGSVGGAVRMNAGGHGSDMAACLRTYSWVDLLSGAEGTDDVSRLSYGYRSSSVASSMVVTAADLGVQRGDAATEQSAISEIVRWRREHQPGGANAGSVFTNPEGDSAGRLIEEAGLKGFRIGSAEVSTKHANFIQADKGGRSGDVLRLMQHVHEVVRSTSGVSLRAEVRLLGFAGEETVTMRHTDAGAA
jgi:UDP-N-acetylmuramate dehydrogenase